MGHPAPGHPARGTWNVAPVSWQQLLLHESGGRDARATAGETPALPGSPDSPIHYLLPGTPDSTARLRSLEEGV